MTGVFVNSAIKTRERDHETLIQNKRLDVKRLNGRSRCVRNHFMGLVSKIWSLSDVAVAESGAI